MKTKFYIYTHVFSLDLLSCSRVNKQTKQQRQVAGVKSHQLNLGMVILATATSNHGHGNAHERFTNHFLAFHFL